MQRDNVHMVSLHVPCVIQGIETSTLFDTGAQVSLMSSKITLQDGIQVEGIVSGKRIEAKPLKDVIVKLGKKRDLKWNFYVAPIKDEVILRLDFLCHHGVRLDFKKGVLWLKNYSMHLKEFQIQNGEVFTINRVILDEKVCIPPVSVMNVMASLEDGSHKQNIVISPVDNNRGLSVPNLLVDAGPKGTVPIQLVNFMERPVTVYVLDI